MGSGRGEAPVAMTTRGARSRSPSTVSTPGSSKRASPMTSRTPGSDSSQERAPEAPLSTIAWTRPITAPTSTENPFTRTPYSAAPRTSCATSALRMRALLGMQPRMGQVPPTRSRSITATLASASDARAAAFIPAMPAPMTIRLTSDTA